MSVIAGDRWPRGLKRAITLSLVAHLLLLVVFVVTSLWRDKRQAPPQTVITTKLVRLGKERPKELLPRKEAPPPPPAATPVNVPPEPKPAKPVATPPPPVEKLPSAQDRISELSRVSSALERLKKQQAAEIPEGHEDGVRDGDVSDISKALVGNKFATEVYKCMQRHYALEGLDAGQVQGKSATVVVRVNPDGKLIDSRIETSSGLASFDRSVERAVKRCGKVSPPDAIIRDQVREDGIEIVFVPD